MILESCGLWEDSEADIRAGDVIPEIRVTAEFTALGENGQEGDCFFRLSSKDTSPLGGS